MCLIETYKKIETITVILILFIAVFINDIFALPVDTVVVKPKDAGVGKNSIYEIYFSLEKEISNNASIFITFPDSFNLAGITIAGSTTIDGGFDLTVNDRQIVLKRSGLGRKIKPYEKVSVKFANVRNPSLPSDDYQIKVEIKNDSNNIIVTENKKISIISQSESR